MINQIQLTKGEIEIEEPFLTRWLEASSIVRSHQLWGDSFMKSLKNPEENPKLSYNLVKEWAQQMYHGSLAFPRYVGNLVGRVSNHAAGRKLAINAAVERGYPSESRSHFLLAVDLLRAMRFADKDIVSIPQYDFSKEYIEGHLYYTKNEELAKGIGCLGLGIEALTTHEFTVLGNAFLKTASSQENLDSSKIYQSQGYFTENIMADEEHQVEFAEIAYLTWKSGELPKSLDESMQQIKEGAKYSLDLRQKFFSGLYKVIKSSI